MSLHAQHIRILMHIRLWLVSCARMLATLRPNVYHLSLHQMHCLCMMPWQHLLEGFGQIDTAPSCSGS